MYTGQNRSHNRVERGGQLRHCLNGRLHHISDRIRRDLESYKYQMGGVKMEKKKPDVKIRMRILQGYFLHTLTL